MVLKEKYFLIQCNDCINFLSKNKGFPSIFYKICITISMSSDACILFVTEKQTTVLAAKQKTPK